MSYKSKLIRVILEAFEKAFYFEQLLFHDVKEEIDEFAEVNCIKVFCMRKKWP